MALDNAGNKWIMGHSYGPVLSQTDLYLLGSELQLHPIFAGSDPSFHLIFNLSNGQTGGFNPNDASRDVPFDKKDESVCLPRVSEILIISEVTPWCTTVRNERGVTMQDVCQAIWKDYSENDITDAEFQSLPMRFQEQVRRANPPAAAGGWGAFYGQPSQPRYKRLAWLRNQIYFEGLVRNDVYTMQRLGFKAPNIFVMKLSA